MTNDPCLGPTLRWGSFAPYAPISWSGLRQAGVRPDGRLPEALGDSGTTIPTIAPQSHHNRSSIRHNPFLEGHNNERQAHNSRSIDCVMIVWDCGRLCEPQRIWPGRLVVRLGRQQKAGLMSYITNCKKKKRSSLLSIYSFAILKGTTKLHTPRSQS